ncbi:alpha/beta hydrolase family protein [Sphingomonas oryzagri]
MLGPLYLPLFDMIENGKSQWSPDSRSIYVLAEANSEIQVHRLDVGDRDDLVTRDGADVSSFSLDADGMGLHYETYNDRAEIDAAAVAAQAHGVLLQPEIFNEGLALFHNYRIGNRWTTIRRAPDGTGTEAFSGRVQRKHLLFASGVTAITPTDTFRADKSVSLQPAVVGHEIQTVDAGKASITLRPLSTDNTGRTTYRVSVTVDGKERPCTATFCQGSITVLRQLDWRASTGELIVRYVPEATRKTMVYGWNPRTGVTRTILSADGMLNGGAQFVDSPCAFSSDNMVCVLSRSAEPPRLVRLDIDSGAISTLAAPNAILAARDMGISRFITWKDPTGRTSSGILTLPTTNTQGLLPLVVNLSSCPGFLEGGSVPLAPEHVLAGKGFASLCANINVSGIDFRDAHGRPQPLAVHKAALVALRAIIDRLAANGTIDRKRVGIVGHSFGAMLAAYALSHSDLFHAAVIGTGVTTDPTSFYLTAPEPESMRRTAFSGQGMPPPDQDPSGVWPDVSAALNADKIRAPLLLLPPESEYLLGLQLYTAIRDAGGIARMIVYPGDGHLLSRQPGHQYEREINSIAWLGCWLTRSTPVTDAEKQQAAISASIPCQADGFMEALVQSADGAAASKNDHAKLGATLPHRPTP